MDVTVQSQVAAIRRAQPVSQPLGEGVGSVDESERRHVDRIAVEADDVRRIVVHRVAGEVLVVHRDAQGLDHRRHPVLATPEPGSTEVQAFGGAVQATTDAFSCFDHGDVMPASCQEVGRVEPAHAGTDDDHVRKRLVHRRESRGE